MSKLKVPVCSFIKTCFSLQKSRRQYLYIITFLKTLREYYTPFIKKQHEDKVLKYWAFYTIPQLISLADKMFEEERYLEVYELLNRIRYSKETQVLWRIARALFQMSLVEGKSEDIRWEMINEAYGLMEMALASGSESADVHKWMAIIMDSRDTLIDLEYRVKHSILVRNHLVKACELNPNDFTVHYMLGKWCYAMSQLNWFQRMIAKYCIASEPPISSYDQAYKYLSRAEDLQPRTFLPSVYLLGRTCIEIGQFYKAKYYLNLALTLPPRDACEKCYVAQAKLLIKKLNKYDIGKNVLFYDEYPFGLHD